MPIHTVSRLIARVAGKFPLRTVLIVPFVVQTVGTVGLVGYLSYQSGQKAVEDLAQQLMAQVGERISDRITTYLQSPQTAVATNHLAVQQRILNINDFEQLRQQLWQQLTLNPSLEALYFGNKSGEEISYGRFQSEETVKQSEKLTGEDLSMGTPHISILRSTDPGKRKYYLVDSKGNPRKLIYTFGIDNRTTLWYRTAQASKQQTWSPISVYKVIPLLGIFAVTPIYDEAGKWQGVFASSFTLSGISTFLDRLDFSPSGQVFIMDRSGKLVATSVQESLLVKPTKGAATQLLAVNSKDTRTRDIAQQLSNKFGNFRTLLATQQLTLVINSEHQFVRVTPYRDKYGLDWLIVAVVPESDFMEQIHANTRTTILLCIAALLGSLGIGVITAGWIAKPIVRLNTAAKDIAKGQWDKSVEIERADEVGQLGESFNQMAAQLQQYFAELQASNQSLAESESKLNQILAAIPVGVSVHNSTGKIIYANQIAQQLLGIETIPEAETEQLAQAYQAYLVGTEQLYPPKNMPVVRSLQGESARIEDMEIRLPDRRVPLEVYSTPLFDETGQIVAAIAAFFDITERQETEKIIADYNRNLETKVAQRTAELTYTNEQLQHEIAERKLLEGKLYSSTQQVRTIFDAITDIVLIIDEKKSLQIIPTKASNWYARDTNQLNSIVQQFFQEDKEEIWFAKVRQVLETQQTINFDYSLHINNQEVWFAAKISPLPNRSVVWVARDISDAVAAATQRKLVEQEIRQLSTALENAVEGISRLDTQGRYIAVNKAYANIVGYQPEEMIGKVWQPTVHPDDLENLIAAYQEMLSTGKVEAEARGIRKDGSIFYKQLVMVTAYDEQHNFIGHYCFMKDISDKKQAEETLQHQLAVIEAASDGIAILNENSEYIYLNKAHVILFGYSDAKELIGKTWKEFYYPEEISRFERDVFPILLQQGHWQGEATGKKQDGTTFAEEISLTLTEGKELICVCQDITQRKQAEEALRESEQRYLAIIQDQTELIARFLPDGTLSFVNEAYCRYFELTREELIGHHFAPIIVEEDREHVNRLVNSLSLENPVVTIENRVIVQSEVRWTQWINRALFDEQGNLIKVQAVGRDITERKRAEQCLRESAQREKAIATVMQRMRQTLDIETIFNATTEELRQVIECDRVVIYQFNSDWSGQFVSESVGEGWISLMQQQTNPNADEQLLNDPSCTLKTIMLRGTPEPVVDSYMQKTKGSAYNEGINYRVTQDIYQAGFTECYLKLLERFQIRAYIIVPIHCGNQLWGLLATYQNSDSRAWSEVEISTVVQIGIQLAVALQQAQLLQQTQQQAIQLEQAKDAAVRAAAQSAAANRAKSQFLANMSHELRTPLNGILGYAQILQADKNCTPKQKKGVDIIHQCGTHLLTLINDILDLSKIEAGKIELYPEDFHLPSFLTSLSEIFQLKATQKSITFTYLPLNQIPRIIHADEKRLRQILMNLLSNAVKFTDRGSVTFKVEVIGNGGNLTPLTPLPTPLVLPYKGRWQRTKPFFHGRGELDSPLHPSRSPLKGERTEDEAFYSREGQGEGFLPNNQQPTTNNKIRFQIVDTGIGIPEEQLEKIFLPFEQVGDISRRAEGTGLGLAITRKIVDLMGGHLFVESTPGVGSKFGFDLDVPVASTAIESTIIKSTHNIIGYELIKADRSSYEDRGQKVEPGVREEGKKRKILIVDDRWENRTVLINILEPIGFELEQAMDGQEGLEKALEFQPDLILADLVMPVMDGYQMTRQLRQLRELQNTIIIAISANAFEVDRLQSQDAGCNDFLPKPFNAEDLLEKLKSYLNLTWIYDNPNETKSQLKGDESSRYSQKLTTEMVIPPKEELLALYEAAETGFVSGVKAQAILLEQLNPDYRAFATRILELAADFEYEEIVKLIDHYLSESPE